MNRIVSSSGSLGTGAYAFDRNGVRVEKCLPNCTSSIELSQGSAHGIMRHSKRLTAWLLPPAVAE